MFQKDMRVSLLLDFYGELLSENRRTAIDLYYNDDLSLSEIADQLGISRQGVRDSIKKGEAQLAEYEDKLGLADRFATARRAIDALSDELRSAADNETDEAKASMLTDVAAKLGTLSI